MIVFFAVTLLWICFAAASAVTGFLIPHLRSPQKRRRSRARGLRWSCRSTTKIRRADCALYAMAEALAQIDAYASFRDRDHLRLDQRRRMDQRVARSRSAAARPARDHAGVVSASLARHRPKAGNVEEFVKRWGSRYDYMIVLDADSIMAPQTLVLVSRMQADPKLGILQTVPM